MNIHKNARLTPIRREEMAVSVIAGQFSRAEAARVFGVSAKIVARWTARFRAEGREGMRDRSSRPKMIPTQTAEALAGRIITPHRQRPTASASAGVTLHNRPEFHPPRSAGFCAAPGCRGCAI